MESSKSTFFFFLSLPIPPIIIKVMLYMRNGGDRLYRSFFFFLFEVQVGRTGRKSLRIFDIRQYIDTTSRILYNHILSAYVDLAIRERLCVYTSSNSSNTAAMRGRRRPASSTVYRAAARNPPS